ncbi:MAG: PEP-CTERM sorting domain-containing protein [Proteobacteria bacterium]|nr:PEP-CTERM sorting domain-containing protein [Pseudomonadota bacterium]
MINNTPEALLALTGSQADAGNCCQGSYNDWMFTVPIPLGNGVYDFFTGTACCVDTMTSPERVTITGITNQGGGIGTGTVPEPATWLTMILGFGLLGAFMRRRHSETVKVTYA